MGTFPGTGSKRNTRSIRPNLVKRNQRLLVSKETGLLMNRRRQRHAVCESRGPVLRAGTRAGFQRMAVQNRSQLAASKRRATSTPLKPYRKHASAACSTSSKQSASSALLIQAPSLKYAFDSRWRSILLTSCSSNFLAVIGSVLDFDE